MADSFLTPQQVDALLDLLSSDDSYRALFQQDLAAAFAKLPGSPKPPADVPPGACLKPNKLASKQQIADARDRIAQDLLSESSLKVFMLEG